MWPRIIGGCRLADARPKKSAVRPPALLATDKLAFLLAFVPWLMDHDRVTVAEAAAHFRVSENRIREAVELIAVSGIPGETSSYQHNDLFDIAWDRFEDHNEIVLTNLVAIDDSPRFSGREAAALIAGLQYLSSLPENADRVAIDSLMAKLARGASATPSPVAVGATETDAALATIRRGVADGVQLEFDYLDSRGVKIRRHADPLRIESVDSDWYLRAWCHLRTAVRTFRLDRISDLELTDVPIEYRAGDIALPDVLFESSPTDLVVIIDVEPAARALIADYLPDDVPTSTAGPSSTGQESVSNAPASDTSASDTSMADGRERISIRVTHYHALKRLIAGLPGVVTVVGPAEARAAVFDWAEAGASRYRSE